MVDKRNAKIFEFPLIFWSVFLRNRLRADGLGKILARNSLNPVSFRNDQNPVKRLKRRFFVNIVQLVVAKKKQFVQKIPHLRRLTGF